MNYKGGISKDKEHIKNRKRIWCVKNRLHILEYKKEYRHRI